MPQENSHERGIRRFADDFRGQVERLRPHVRGGDRPPFTEKLTPHALADPLVVARVADDLEARGLHEQATEVRLRSARAVPPPPRSWV